jgi:hypothetical protein
MNSIVAHGAAKRFLGPSEIDNAFWLPSGLTPTSTHEMMVQSREPVPPFDPPKEFLKAPAFSERE